MLMPAPIRTDGSNIFARHTMAQRLPQLIRQVQQANTFHPSILRALDQLHDDLVQDVPIPLLRYPAPDADQWAQDFAARRGDTWQNSQWFFAEVYFFRQIIQATRYFETGVDPFLSIKLEEFYSDRLRALIQRVLAEEPADPAEQLHGLLAQMLWANRVDLSLNIAGAGQQGGAEDLLVDDRPAAVALLLGGTGPVHLICDNAGSEQAMDLALVDALLRRHIPVVLHVKMHPTYVSDATAHDIWYFISDLIDGDYDSPDDDAPAAFGLRLSAALDEGRLRLAPDFYWNSPRWLDDLPLRLQHTFAGARLVILKGDANYRRLLHDTIYPADVPFAQVAAAFPAPLLAIRTLKSDPV
ncbi:MAG: damage-control phosphatase ARMT1 family protein, partial [Anaerolineae bacterium]|nr:damage-control phosphatase ARMT1 family protein [Anaerolineae bacterium]